MAIVVKLSPDSSRTHELDLEIESAKLMSIPREIDKYRLAKYRLFT